MSLPHVQDIAAQLRRAQVAATPLPNPVEVKSRADMDQVFSNAAAGWVNRASRWYAEHRLPWTPDSQERGFSAAIGLDLEQLRPDLPGEADLQVLKWCADAIHGALHPAVDAEYMLTASPGVLMALWEDETTGVREWGKAADMPLLAWACRRFESARLAELKSAGLPGDRLKVARQLEDDMLPAAMARVNETTKTIHAGMALASKEGLIR